MRFTPWAAAFLASTLIASMPVFATDEVEPGTVITSSNIDQFMNREFAGDRLSDLIPERVAWMVRQQGLTMKLAKEEPYPPDPRVEELTKEYANRVHFNEGTRNVEGYVAGRPFPTVDLQDRFAGDKIMWNFRYGRQKMDNFYSDEFAYVLIDGDTGVEREQIWYVISHDLIGNRRANYPVTWGDGSIFNKSIIAALNPQDIKGLGLYTIRYADGRLDDIWAYIRTVRRVRRLSGGAWVDPIGGTDQLSDDFDIFNAHPSWYSSFRVLGKRKILVMADARSRLWDRQKIEQTERYPQIDVSHMPYWNYIGEWQPKDVFIVEGVPPTYHPYSKKIMYIGTEAWNAFFAEIYDRKGDFWKTIIQWHKCYCGAYGRHNDWGAGTTDSSRNIVWPVSGLVADYQRRHATIYIIDQQKFDLSDFGPNDISLGMMEAKAR